MPETIAKRDGKVVPFDLGKIVAAITKANDAMNGGMSGMDIRKVSEIVADRLDQADEATVELCQDMVEEELAKSWFNVARAYMIYRAGRAHIRKAVDKLMPVYDEIAGRPVSESDIMRENANIDSNTAMGAMLKYGSEGAKWYVDEAILPKHIAEAHRNGDIHIHDKDFYLLTETCCQIDLRSLFRRGFSTGHGGIRDPQSVRTAASLACIIIQANQNEMHGGQSIPAFDYDMAYGVRKTWRKAFLKAVDTWNKFRADDAVELPWNFKKATNARESVKKLMENGAENLKWAFGTADAETEEETYQAMESFVHNMNTMHSRSGGQVPFSSVNYGTDTSWEGRLVIRQLLRATQEGLGNGETPIFPVQIFKVRSGVNYNPGDPNYDLFVQSVKVSAQRMFPNYEFLDAPFNAQFLRGNDPAYEVATMGCVQKDQVVTCLIDNAPHVESVSRIYDMLAERFGTRLHGLSEYIDVEGKGIFIYDSAAGGFVEMKKSIKNPPRKDWLLIKCENGRSLPLTPDHPLPVVGRGRTPAREIRIGDEIPAVWGQVSAQTEYIDPKLAWLYGLNLDFSLEDYPPEELKKLLEQPEKALLDKFGGEDKVVKYIPSCVFSWNDEAKMAFLAGMFDSDGKIGECETGDCIVIEECSEEISIQRALLFQALHIPAMMRRIRHCNDYGEFETFAVECPLNADFRNKFASFVADDEKKAGLMSMSVADELEMPENVRVHGIGAYRYDDGSGMDRYDGFAYDFETASGRFDVSGLNSHNCRTRVMANVHKEGERTFGRGNLSFTTINLPRIALEAETDLDEFYRILQQRMELVREQLLHRLKIQSNRRVFNYPFLMGNGIWIGSDALDWNDKVGDVLKHGTLTIGFIGLAETLILLTGKHHGESAEAQKLGLEIIGKMREFCDKECAKGEYNFSLIGTPAEGLAGRFPKLDREKFGVIKGVNDRDYYTNSFHVPVWHKIKAFEKIGIEAPYHNLCNGGHITYVELDGDTAKNEEAFMSIVRYMHDSNIGYGSVNHPVDRDPVCGYVGVIGDVCPRCGRKAGEPVSAEKLREIRKKYGQAHK